MSYGIYTSYIVTDESITTFNTGRPYQVGTNTLFVYVNGLLAELGAHYREVNTLTIEFIDELQIGDRITITSSFINNELKVDFALIGKGSNAMFKKYDDKVHLMNNQSYDIELAIGTKVYNYHFVTKYSPMFSSEKLVRFDLQEVLDDMPSNTINFTIWQNSKLAIELTDSTGEYQYYTNGDDIDLTDIPYYAKQWVRYKTELDLLDAIYLSIATKQGSESKKIGNIEVSRSYTLPYVSELKKGVKAKLLPFERLLTGVKVIGKSARKAGGSTYPISDRRSF